MASWLAIALSVFTMAITMIPHLPPQDIGSHCAPNAKREQCLKPTLRQRLCPVRRTRRGLSQIKLTDRLYFRGAVDGMAANPTAVRI